MLGCLIYAVYALMVNYENLGYYRYFILMLSLSAFQILVSDFTFVYNGAFTRILRNIYILVEYLILINYFKIILENNKLKLALNIVFTISISYLFFQFIIKKSEFSLATPVFASYETILFLILSILYYLQILTNPNLFPLLKTPNFILVSGIFFFFGISSPIFFLQEVLDFKRLKISLIEDLIVGVSYMILFLSIAKSALCLKYSKI